MTDQEKKDAFYQCSGAYNSEEHFVQVQKAKIVLIILCLLLAGIINL